ncbi:MAG: hypothetical protein ACREJO_00875 [Phycisphaerales bacterium]
MNRSVIAAVIGCAGLAAAANAQVGAWHVESRWVITGIDGGAVANANGDYIPTPGASLALPVGGATAILLTLQARTVFDTNFSSSGTTSARTGNFNVYTVGFGPGSVPATIIRSGAIAGTLLHRGDWGLDPNVTADGDPSEFNAAGDGPALVRGAAPGVGGPNTDTDNAARTNFAAGQLRGLRFWQAYDPAGNDADGNLGVGPSTMPNGFITPGGNITDINLLRTLYARPGTAAGAGHAVWQTPAQTGIAVAARRGNLPDPVSYFDVYRTLLTSTTPLTLGTGLDVTFAGFINTSTQENASNNNLNLTNDATVLAQLTTATISFGQVPTPGAAALMGLGGLMVARRRR